MPKFWISGRIPGSDEDSHLSVTPASGKEEDAIKEFKESLYNHDKEWAELTRDNPRWNGEFKDDEWPAYITHVVTTYEPELGLIVDAFEEVAWRKNADGSLTLTKDELAKIEGLINHVKQHV